MESLVFRTFATILLIGSHTLFNVPLLIDDIQQLNKYVQKRIILLVNGMFPSRNFVLSKVYAMIGQLIDDLFSTSIFIIDLLIFPYT